MKKNNPYATKEILKRLFEANKRGYWKANEDKIEKIEEKYLELDGMLEDEVML